MERKSWPTKSYRSPRILLRALTIGYPYPSRMDIPILRRCFLCLAPTSPMVVVVQVTVTTGFGGGCRAACVRHDLGGM